MVFDGFESSGESNSVGFTGLLVVFDGFDGGSRVVFKHSLSNVVFWGG